MTTPTPDLRSQPAFDTFWLSTAFTLSFALLLLSFYFMPDQAGRNLLLYLTAAIAHGFAFRKASWQSSFGHPGGWLLLLLVIPPALSQLWSTGLTVDRAKDLTLAAYSIAAIYLGVATTLSQRPPLANILASLMLIAGSLAGAAAIGIWATDDSSVRTFRLEGVWGIDNPVHASVLLLAGTLPVLAQVLRGERSYFWLAGLVVPVCFVVLAGARAAGGAYLLVVLGMVLVQRLRAASSVAIGLLVLAAVVVLVAGPEAVEKVWTSRGISFRDVVWEQVWEAFRGCNDLVGCGVGTRLSVEFGGVTGTRAHSIYMAALYSQGWLGLFVFCAVLVSLLWRTAQSGPGMAGVLRGWGWMLGFVLLANVTSGHHVLVRGALFWPSFWIPVMVIAAMAGRGRIPEGRS